NFAINPKSKCSQQSVGKQNDRQLPNRQRNDAIPGYQKPYCARSAEQRLQDANTTQDVESMYGGEDSAKHATNEGHSETDPRYTDCPACRVLHLGRNMKE